MLPRDASTVSKEAWALELAYIRKDSLRELNPYCRAFQNLIRLPMRATITLSSLHSFMLSIQFRHSRDLDGSTLVLRVRLTKLLTRLFVAKNTIHGVWAIPGKVALTGVEPAPSYKRLYIQVEYKLFGPAI
mgnify:CR=1 FL=1